MIYLTNNWYIFCWWKGNISKKICWWKGNISMDNQMIDCIRIYWILLMKGQHIHFLEKGQDIHLLKKGQHILKLKNCLKICLKWFFHSKFFSNERSRHILLENAKNSFFIKWICWPFFKKGQNINGMIAKELQKYLTIWYNIYLKHRENLKWRDRI